MAEFGWAFLDNVIEAQGADGSVQIASGSLLTGSNNFVFATSSNTLFLTGTMIISGTLQAHTFDVIHTNKIELSASGGSNFGNDNTDQHIFTGSVSIVSGGLRQHYYNVTGSPYTILAHDSIIGVSHANATSITLPNAATAGFGKILIIKDETDVTRVELKKITVSAHGSQKIDRDATYSLTGDNPALTLYSNGDDRWFIY